MAITAAAIEEVVFRPFKSYPPALWSSTFTEIPTFDSEFEAYTKQVDELKEQVKDMLIESSSSLTANIEFINLMCRLGVSYLFETEIDDHLSRIFKEFQNICQENDLELDTIATAFRVLRQHGYKLSCEVFNKFKNNDGEFDINIANDVNGLLSLYEASFLSVRDEEILDHALDFTKKHLQAVLEKSSLRPNLAKFVKKSLDQPLHHGIERIEIMHYISFYEKEESRNDTLLKFAKLDYNRVQLLYKKELALLSAWSKDLKLTERFPYARDRLVEGYFWIFGSICEPQYSYARIMGSKYIHVVSILDDTYDTYGTFDEIKLFQAALESGSNDDINKLPNYMKVLYQIIMDLFAETENQGDEEFRQRASYAKEKFHELARCYFVEAHWLHGIKGVPRFDEYIKNGLTTSGFGSLVSGTMIGMDELGVKDIEWMESHPIPKVIRASKLIGRLLNDTKPHQGEFTWRDLTVGVKSYMNEYGLSEEEAVKAIQKLCATAFQEINEACMKPYDGSWKIIKIFLNHARVTDFAYLSVDVYTCPEVMKDIIEPLFIKPFLV